ncbi:MAG TPA: hypothetical protein VIY96_05130 [Thermoanaerobaculia bacterium]
MPVSFKIVLMKNSQGEIQVNGNYVSGSDPVLVERVNLEELDASGATIGVWTQRMTLSIDPTPGSYLLFTKPPSGSNVKGARATARYIVIDKSAQSTVLNL